jgi:hypothetical protein
LCWIAGAAGVSCAPRPADRQRTQTRHPHAGAHQIDPLVALDIPVGDKGQVVGRRTAPSRFRAPHQRGKLRHQVMTRFLFVGAKVARRRNVVEVVIPVTVVEHTV